MRSTSIVAGGVEIRSYDSMVSCQWPNVLPGVSALSWSFVVSVRAEVKDSTDFSVKLGSERCYSNLQMWYKYRWSFTINRKNYDLWHTFGFHYIFTKCNVGKLSSHLSLLFDCFCVQQNTGVS